MAELRRVLQKISIESFERLLSLRLLKVDLSVLLLVAAIASYTVCFSYFTLVQDYAFRTYAWDLGIFNQSFWTTLHNGKFFYSAVELPVNPSGSFFGIHFSPILLLLLPVYAIYPSPQTLLVLQSLIMALGTVPLYKIVMRTLKSRLASLIFVSAYLLYAPLQGINCFDFHVQSLLPLFFLSAIYFFEKQSWKGYFLFTVLALACEEHVAMIVFFFGILAIVQHRKRILSALRARSLKDTILWVASATMILAVLWYSMSMWVRSTFFPSDPAYLSTFKGSANWSVLGAQDPLMIPFCIILYPARAILALGYGILTKIGYLLILFGSLAFLPFFKPKLLLPTIPWFLLALFSNYLPYYVIYNQYPAYLMAFFFVAAIHAIDDREKRGFKAARRRLVAMLLCSLVAFAVVSPLSPVLSMFDSNWGIKPMTTHDRLVHEILAYIPPDASIITHNNLFPQVSGRINAYATPTIDPIWKGRASECAEFIDKTLEKVDYVLVDMKSDGFSSGVVFSLLRGNHSFGVVASADGIVLFKKNYAGDSTILEPYDVRYDYNSLTLYSGEIIGIPNSTSKMVMHFNGLSASSPMFWYGPRSLLPPGTYNVTLRLNVNGTGEIFTVEICTDNGSKILTSKTFSADNLAGKGNWTDQTFQLDLEKPLVDFEVRGVNVSADADIYLDYVDVKQVNPLGVG